MKFGKEFTAQMVPEWQQAYMDYNFLKTLLKEIQRFKQRNRPPITPGGLKRKTTLYRAFSGLIQKHNPMSPSYSSDVENQDILVNSVSRDGEQSYETTFLMSSDEGGEYELVYFRRLDDEFNKVDQFYISKVQETMKEAAILNKQMDALIAFRIKVENPQGVWFDRSVEMTRLASDIAASTAELSLSTPAGARTSRRDRHMDVIEEIGESSHRHSDESSGDNKESNNIKQTEFISISHDQLRNRSTSVVHNRRAKTPSPKPASDIAASTVELPISTPTGARTSRRAHLMDVTEEIGESSHGQSDELSDDNKESNNIKQNVQATKPPVSIKTNDRPASLEILNRVKINHTLDTPRSTIKGVLGVPQPTQLKFSRKNLRKVEDQLKRAFVEFHQKLRFLKSYCFLNTLAFSKIMKKYDKITSRNAAKSYMKMVDNSYLGSSDEVSKLLERVEATFIKHFSNSNRSKGMNILRPTAKRERHRTSFSTGFLAGCTTALVVALISTIRAHKILAKPGKKQYMDNMFPLYSLFALLVLHMLMYAANIYYWRKYRVNYSFIFGFKQGTELGYRQVLLVSFAISVLALLTVFSNLDMEIDPITKNYNAFTEALPLILLVVLFALLLLPFNILYRSSRFFFLVCLFHCIAAPLYKVTLPDFFLADQFTSQVQALRILEFYICYYVWGDFELRNNACKSSTVYKSFLFIVAAIPYMSRLLQCLRRLFEEKDPMQGYNGLKYFLTIVAVCMRTALSINKGLGWKITAWMFSISAAIVGTYWDLVFDWGLLNRHSKNRWLRDKLLVPQKSVYFIAMGLNILLRFAWLQTVLNFHFTFLHRNTMITIVASLEIIRRGIWNFFRLENEHLNNVGKYRAFKSVPLPFNYDEDEDKED